MPKKLAIVTYHYVREILKSRYPHIKGLEYQLFREQVRFLATNFNIVTMEEVIDSSEEGKELLDNAMLLTFDDGYLDHYSYVYPVLKELEIKGSFFIPGEIFTERKLLEVNKIHYILASAEAKQLYADVLQKLNDVRQWGDNFSTNDELIEQYAIPNRFDSGEVIFIKRILQFVLQEEIRSLVISELFHEYVGMSEETLAHEL